MKVLNKLAPGINFIAIETSAGDVERIDFKDAEKLVRDLKEALYDNPKTIVKNEEGVYVYE